MYDAIYDIIDHTYQNISGVGDQQYIYYTSGALICLFAVVFVDLIYRIFRHFWR